jgi:hypothetical protein
MVITADGGYRGTKTMRKDIIDEALEMLVCEHRVGCK